MEKNKRILVLIITLLLSSLCVYLFGFVFFTPDWMAIISDISFWVTLVLYFFLVNEIWNWVKEGKRSELADLVFIAFLFFLIFFLFKDLMTSFMGAFFIYLLLGRSEVKEYEVLSKLLDISLITYAIIFFSGIISRIINNDIIINTAFSFSIWIILGLGFAYFGRKYIIVFRFMSPEYLTLLLYVLAWLIVIFINQYTPLNFIDYIYYVLLITNWVIYFISGPILDKMLGIKKVQDEKLLNLVNKLKEKVGIRGKVKVGFGKYPILNAMAYGSFLDKRVAIIAEDISEIAEDEIDGIIAHELAHTKEYHTLILTLLTSIDLIFRMILNIPATYYDYVFGNPSIPLVSFIILNLGIYVILFIFVRILEGRADLKTKKIGLGLNLAKALYNLESFYAHGREVGLNTILLAEEKQKPNNTLLDYMSTAEYINNSMIKPSRLSLLSNFINSHPPTYFRIAAILGDNLKPLKEAFLTFSLMKKSKQRKYAAKFSQARELFTKVATTKFKEKFEISNIPEMMEQQNKKEIYQKYFNKTYLFKNKVTKAIILGKLIDISFTNEITNPVEFIIENLDGNIKEKINPSFYSSVEFQIDGKYFFEKENPITLTKVDLLEDHTKGNFVFKSISNDIIHKNINKTKLPKSIEIIENLRGKEVFFTTKGTISIRECTDIIPSEIYGDYKISLQEYADSDDNLKPIVYNLKDLIIKTSENGIGIIFYRDLNTKPYELKILEWLKDKQIRTSIFLKKPVNNEEVGYIQKNIVNFRNQDEIEKSKVIIKNIFGEEIEIPYKKIELVLFNYDSIVILHKNKTSIFSKLGYKILKKFAPQKIFI